MAYVGARSRQGWRAIVAVIVMCACSVAASGDAGERTGDVGNRTLEKPHETATANTVKHDDASLIRVGLLVYSDGKSGACFDDGFLTVVDRESAINVNRRFEPVSLVSDEVFGYPFVVMSGKGRFALSETGQRNLGTFLSRGGFVLASARCSDQAWGESFVQAIQAALPGVELEVMTPEHPVFHTLYDIDRITTLKATDEAAFFGVNIGGRLAVVFSPLGVNDAANVGVGCRCCCGNEVRGAAQINANILVYALTH